MTKAHSLNKLNKFFFIYSSGVNLKLQSYPQKNQNGILQDVNLHCQITIKSQCTKLDYETPLNIQNVKV